MDSNPGDPPLRVSPAPQLLSFLRLRRFNSPGFFFVSFVVPIVAYETMNASGPEMGLLFSLQLAGNMLGAPLSGSLANRPENRGWLIFAGSVGRAIAYVIIFLAILQGIYPLMVFGTLCLGVGAGFFWTPMEAVISDGTPYAHRAEVFGRASREDGIGSIVGSVFAFSLWTLATNQGWPLAVALASFPLFAIANVYAGIRILATASMVPRLTSVPQHLSVQQLGRFPIPNRLRGFFFALLALLFLESLVTSLVGPFLQVYLLNHVTSDKAYLSLLYLPGALASMLFAPRLGRLADHVRPELWLLLTSLLAASATWILVNTTSFVLILFAFVVQNLGVAAANLAITKAVSELSLARRGSVMGLKSFISQSGGVVGPLVGGGLWQIAGDRSPFLLSLIAKVCLGFAYYFAFRGVKVHLEDGDESLEPQSA